LALLFEGCEEFGGAAEVRQSNEDFAIGGLKIRPKVTEEQKRALEEAVKRAIEDWLKNKSTPRKLRGGLILSEGDPY